MVSEHASPLAAVGAEDAGGQNVHVAGLAVQLARRGARVVVHTRRDGVDLPRRVALAPGAEVDHVDAGPPEQLAKDELLVHMGAFARELSRCWQDQRPDVVHAHFWMSGMAAVAAARPLGVPVVLTFHALGTVKRRHQGRFDTSPPSRIDSETRLLSSVERVVATCSDEVFELARLGADTRRVTIVPSGVDLDLFSPTGPVAPRHPRGHRLLAVGRLVSRKGLGELVEALAEVPDTELVVAGGPPRPELGSDPEARRLTELARRTSVTGRLHLLGRVGRRELPALMRSADAVVCVPWYEPFGIVPIEAMACEVPVVASCVGGLVDSVVDHVSGLHVAPRQPASLAATLRELLGDPALRRRLGRGGLARARARYGWPRVAEATMEVYASVAGQRVRGSAEMTR